MLLKCNYFRFFFGKVKKNKKKVKIIKKYLSSFIENYSASKGHLRQVTTASKISIPFLNKKRGARRGSWGESNKVGLAKVFHSFTEPGQADDSCKKHSSRGRDDTCYCMQLVGAHFPPGILGRKLTRPPLKG